MDDLKKFARELEDVDFRKVVAGAVVEEVTRVLAMYGLGKTDLYYSWVIRGPEDKYVWGVGTNDILSVAAGAALTGAGVAADDKDLREFGAGWWLAFTCVKLIAEPLYGLIMAYDPVWPKALGAKAQKQAAKESSPTRRPAGIVIKL